MQIKYENGTSTLQAQVTNKSNVLSNMKNIYFHIKDSSGKEIIKLTGHVGNDGILPGETRTVSASYGDDITSLSTMEIELGVTTKATLKDTKQGNYEFKNMQIKYENGTSTLQAQVTNISEALSDMDKIYFHVKDISGNEIIKLTGYVGNDGIAPGKTKTISVSYGDDITSLSDLEITL